MGVNQEESGRSSRNSEGKGDESQRTGAWHWGQREGRGRKVGTDHRGPCMPGERFGIYLEGKPLLVA